jgi:hypothetical protein
LVFEARTRESRARAEEALVRFALLAGEHARDFVVIGGLNPDFLAPESPVPHQGTTDVDLLFELGFVYDRDDLNFAWLDDALLRGGFVESQGYAGWQWTGILGDAKVRLDLLCDVADSPGQTVELPGATEAAAQNLNGPAAALHDPVSRSFAVPNSVRDNFPDSPQQVDLRFASLGGYIAAKSAALLARQKEKDAYDLMFVIMYAPGGPRAAAIAARQARVPDGRPQVSETIRSAVSQFSESSSDMTSTAVRVLMDAGDESEEEQLRSDVSVASRRFLESFDANGVERSTPD